MKIQEKDKNFYLINKTKNKNNAAQYPKKYAVAYLFDIPG